MTRIWCAAVLLGLMTAVPPANAWDRGDVDVLTVLPDATPGQPSNVEGLTVGPDGNIYVSTFGFNASGALTGNAVLYVIKPDGKLLRQVTIANSSPHVLGLRFNPVNGFLLVLDFGGGKIEGGIDHTRFQRIKVRGCRSASLSLSLRQNPPGVRKGI